MVHVKKVEIYGFKSFGFTNTTVQFEPGLVSISGPNGSGKSNILDAIIFAMGENKPKIMRVDKLRSLIHDIEGSRRAPKMARSSVHFDNADRKIPVDSDLVEITREMDEQGENTYYLNKKKTNRSHILDLLDMANAGLGQLNAVQQGTVTRISEFTSEEKRRTIEDLIGLSYFDEKKSEAVKNLDEADRRLEIALAKMGEIKKRIDELEEERNQKLRHDMLGRELERYRAISAANRLKAITAQKEEKQSAAAEVDSKAKDLDGQRQAVRSEAKELDAIKSGLMAQANDYARTKAELDAEISRAMEQYELDNTAISASKKRIAQIESRLPEIKGELREISDARARLESEMAQARLSIQETESKKLKINEDLMQVDSRRNKILGEQSRVAAIKSDIDSKIKALTGERDEAKLKLSKNQGRKESCAAKIKENADRLAQVEQAITESTTYIAQLDSKMQAHKERVAELESKLQGHRARKAKAESDIEKLDSILEMSSKAATKYESKIKTVKGYMHEDYTVAKLKEDASALGIVGLVYEMVSWDKQYERPVMAVSSDWIKAVVVRDFETLFGVAEAARGRRLPKLKIIPLEAIPKFELDLPKRDGVLGVLSDYVRCGPEHAALATFLFGNVVLTANRESAYAISRDGYKAVTMQGEYFEARAQTVIVDINSRISQLTKLISMSSDIDGLLHAINQLKRRHASSKAKLKRADEAIHLHAGELSAEEKSLTSAAESRSHIESAVGSKAGLKSRLEARIAELGGEISGIDSGVLAAESHVDSLNERIGIVEGNYAGGEQARIASELAKVNSEKSAAEGRFTGVMSEYRDRSSRLTALQTQDSKEASQAARLDAESESLGLESTELRDKVAALESQIQPKKDALVALREREQQLIATYGSSPMGAIKEHDDRLRELTDGERDLTRQINSLERQSDSLARDLRDLGETATKLRGIVSAFGLGRDAETFDVEGVVGSLTAELASLNALNAKAPETYLEVSHGYRSMSARKNSLEEERNKIVRFIEEIEKDKRQTFLDAFDRVDKEIRLIFGKMTGGNAWLELQNEDDIFSSGISYLIQFPNKTKRESTSISGGEKTLAAIVFVLALQKLKPSPFYLFDEVDAHLDAPNSERLANILEERAKESQFIMVSLKDSVVQKARLIYGVFPKNGVSNVVTYKDKRMPLSKSG